MRDTIWVPVVAVLGPLVGSAIGVLLPSRESLLRRLLAFAAGTMLTLSFLELLPESLAACSPPACAAGLAVGVFGVLALHRLLPAAPNAPSAPRRTALLMVAAIMLHNLPEGIAMAAGGQSRTMLLIAVAIAALLLGLDASVRSAIFAFITAALVCLILMIPLIHAALKRQRQGAYPAAISAGSDDPSVRAVPDPGDRAAGPHPHASIPPHMPRQAPAGKPLPPRNR